MSVETLNVLVGRYPMFFAWLREQPEGAVVGYSGKCLTCPMAMFLQSKLRLEQGQYVTVGSIKISVWPSEGLKLGMEPLYAVDTPRWVSRFVHQIDRGLGNTVPNEGTPITARDAIEALTRMMVITVAECGV